MTDAIQAAGWMWRGIVVWHKPSARPMVGEFRRDSEFIVYASKGNTPAKKPRKVKLELTIKPNEQRNMAEVVIATSCTTCAPEPLETSITFGKDFSTGEVEAFEMAPAEDAMQHTFPGTLENGKILKLHKEAAHA